MGLFRKGLNKSRPCPLSQRQQRGFTLLEVAVLLGIMSIVLIPMTRMAGGGGQTSAIGKTETDASRNRTREVTAANTLMEQALAGNISAPNFDWSQLSPTAMYNSGIQQYSHYNRPVNYDWNMINLSYQTDHQGNVVLDSKTGQPVPLVQGNYLAAATLRLFPAAGSTQPTLIFPTTLYARNSNNPTPPTTKVGVMLVLDTSGSMSWSSADYSLPDTTQPTASNPLVVSSPYLIYRYNNGDLTLTNDNELDVVCDLQNDNTSTPYDETYIPGRSTAANVSPKLKMNPNCAANASNGTYFIDEAMNGSAPVRTTWNGKPLNTLQSYVQGLCSITSSMSASTWQNILNTDMSRIEAARSALFSFLYRLESNPFLSSNLRLGFETFNTSPTSLTPPLITVRSQLEDPSGAGKFVNTRLWLSYINRQVSKTNKTTLIPVLGGTPTYPALTQAADLLYADNTLTSRMIILITDGVPTDPNASQIPTLMYQLGNGSYGAGNGHPISVFSVGVVGADSTALNNWASQNVAGGGQGQSFFAASVADTLGVLDSVADSVIRQVLSSNTCRYSLQTNPTTSSPGC